MRKNIKGGFTLVELIIVITILAILRTIGFMSFQSYTIDARDGKRVTDLGVLRKGLEIYGTKNQTLINPDNYVTISGASLQGYAGINVLKALKISDDTKDPKDKEYYTYAKDITGKKYQLLAMLENKNTLAYNQNLLNQANATDYTTRYTFTTGGNFGIYLSGTTQTPVQEGNSGTTITNTGSLTLITNSEGGGANVSAYMRGTTYIKGQSFSFDGLIWYVSANLKVAYTKDSGTNIFPNNLTDSDNIMVFDNGRTLIKGTNAFILRTVNEGSTEVYNYGTAYSSGRLWNEGSTTNYGANTTTRRDSYTQDKAMLGNYYQWGRNDPVSMLSTTNTLYNATGYQTGGINISGINFIVTGTSPYSWIDSIQHNTSSGILWTNTENWNNGPCPTGYHIPTTTDIVGNGELRKVVELVTGLTTGWNSTNVRNLQKYLLLPMAGSRIESGAFNSQGALGGYWRSTPYTSTWGFSGHFMFFSSMGGIDPSKGSFKAYGYFVRCFKN